MLHFTSIAWNSTKQECSINNNKHPYHCLVSFSPLLLSGSVSRPRQNQVPRTIRRALLRQSHTLGDLLNVYFV